MGINEYRDAGSSVPGNVVRDMLIGLQYAGNDVCVELFLVFDNMCGREQASDTWKEVRAGQKYVLIQNRKAVMSDI